MVLAFDVIRKGDVTNRSIRFLPVKLEIPPDPPSPAPVPPAQGTSKRDSVPIDPVLAATLPFPGVRSIRTESDFYLDIGTVPAAHQVGGSLSSGGGGIVLQWLGARSELARAWLDFNPHQPVARKPKKKAVLQIGQALLLAEHADDLVARAPDPDPAAECDALLENQPPDGLVHPSDFDRKSRIPESVGVPGRLGRSAEFCQDLLAGHAQPQPVGKRLDQVSARFRRRGGAEDRQYRECRRQHGSASIRDRLSRSKI